MKRIFSSIILCAMIVLTVVALNKTEAATPRAPHQTSTVTSAKQ